MIHESRTKARRRVASARIGGSVPGGPGNRTPVLAAGAPPGTVDRRSCGDQQDDLRKTEVCYAFRRRRHAQGVTDGRIDAGGTR